MMNRLRTCILLRVRCGIAQPSLKWAGTVALLMSLATFTVPTLVYGLGGAWLWGVLLLLDSNEKRWPSLLWLCIAEVLTVIITALLYEPAIDFALHHRLRWSGRSYIHTGWDIIKGRHEWSVRARFPLYQGHEPLPWELKRVGEDIIQM
jgi:hypothetical protein